MTLATNTFYQALYKNIFKIFNKQDNNKFNFHYQSAFMSAITNKKLYTDLAIASLFFIGQYQIDYITSFIFCEPVYNFLVFLVKISGLSHCKFDTNSTVPLAVFLLILILWSPLRSVISIRNYTEFEKSCFPVIFWLWTCIKIINLTDVKPDAMASSPSLRYFGLSNNEYELARANWIWVNVYVIYSIPSIFKVNKLYKSLLQFRFSVFLILVDVILIASSYEALYCYLWPSYVRVHGYDKFYWLFNDK